MIKIAKNTSYSIKIEVFFIEYVVCNMKRITSKTQTQLRSMIGIFTEVLETQYEKKIKRNIWEDSKWKHIAELENDDVGKVGEETIQRLCKDAGVLSEINGLKTKELGGGNGDGCINGKSVEIKTARLGSTGSSFQHELGECPWNADYMMFIDIGPSDIYITLFPNFSEEFYKKSGTDSSIKCGPYFPTKSICWRKQKGAFKLDTTVSINETNNYTFKWDETKSSTEFGKFINNIIPRIPDASRDAAADALLLLKKTV